MQLPSPWSVPCAWFSQGDDDLKDTGFHLTTTNQGASAAGPGFSLKFWTQHEKGRKKKKTQKAPFMWVDLSAPVLFSVRGTRCFSLWKKLKYYHRFQGSCFINQCGVYLLHSIRGLELPESPRIITNCDKGQLEITVLEQFLVCF